jgi:hypothetical protein
MIPLKEQVDSRNYALPVAAATGVVSGDAERWTSTFKPAKVKSWLVQSFWANRAVESQG